jgi:hypothetical protein
MFLSAYLAIALGQPVPEGFAPRNTADRMTFLVKSAPAGWVLDWFDTEDRVRGTVTPSELSAGDPLTVSVSIGAFSGGDFDGPVTLSLEAVGGTYRELQTVPAPATTPRVWTAKFIPPATGTYSLEIAFRTSRQKPLRGLIEVGMGRVPRTAGFVIGIGAIGLAVVYGLFLLFSKNGERREGQGPPPVA